MTDNDNHGTIAAAELGRIIDDAALFASRDSTLPMLNAIRLESTPKRLQAIATDRFTLGVSMADYSGPGPEFELQLELPQAQMVSKLAKSCKAAFSEVTITTTDDTVAFDFTSGLALTVPKQTGYQFVDWRKIIGNQVAVESTDNASPMTIGVNPLYLARFGRVRNARQMVMKATTPSKPILVQIGESFAGVLMPIRINSDAAPLWETAGWFPKPEPEPAPAPNAPAPVKRAPAKRAAARKPRKAATRVAVPA